MDALVVFRVASTLAKMLAEVVFECKRYFLNLE